MHTVDLLELALAATEQLGFKLRHEWLGGAGGGACLIRGQKWLFVDLAVSPAEQLVAALAAVRGDPGAGELELPAELGRLLNLRKSA